MKHPEENVALQAVEFWSTVCEEEIDLAIEAAEVHILLSCLRTIFKLCHRLRNMARPLNMRARISPRLLFQR